jgi:polyhydroxyalkanoate synthesis regulator phasin
LPSRLDDQDRRRAGRAPRDTYDPGMAEAEELEERVAVLETQVHGLVERVQRSEHDATAARVLAGGVDRDVSEIRAEIRDFRDQNNRVLNAMRDDLTDLTERMDHLTERLDGLTERLGGLAERTEGGFAQVRGALDATAAGQSHIVELVDQLIRRGS